MAGLTNRASLETASEQGQAGGGPFREVWDEGDDALLHVSFGLAPGPTRQKRSQLQFHKIVVSPLCVL